MIVIWWHLQLIVTIIRNCKLQFMDAFISHHLSRNVSILGAIKMLPDHFLEQWTKSSHKWSYRLHFQIPLNLLLNLGCFKSAVNILFLLTQWTWTWDLLWPLKIESCFLLQDIFAQFLEIEGHCSSALHYSSVFITLMPPAALIRNLTIPWYSG